MIDHSAKETNKNSCGSGGRGRAFNKMWKIGGRQYSRDFHKIGGVRNPLPIILRVSGKFRVPKFTTLQQQ